MQTKYLKADKSDRAKAAGATLVIHLLLGTAILTGLAMHLDRQHDFSLTTFNVEPPLPLPAPAEIPNKTIAQDKPAPAAKKAIPRPVTAPKPKLPVKAPLTAAPIPGQGAAASVRAAASGTSTGTGAGGSGDGTGVGNGGVIGARLLSGALNRSDFRDIADLGSSQGTAELLLLVNKAGRVERCRALGSSGNPKIDALLCQLLVDRARFAPAHAPDGTLYYQDVHYFPRWGR